MTEKDKIPPLNEAATVVLVQEMNNQLEIYLLKRSTKAGFMAGLYVFPGGHVDEQDKGLDDWKPFIDLSSDQLEHNLSDHNFPIENALSFSIASIRETFEEAGVLIASKKDNTQTDFDEIVSYRFNKNLSPSWFKDKIMDDNWTLSLSNLGKWSHWITPKLMKKRFDTRFFIALMPENQTCIPDNMETSHGVWLTPDNALEQNLKGEIPLSPPTIVTLTQISKFKSLNAFKKEMKTHGWGDPIAPRLVPSEKGPVILEPWDEECETENAIDMSTIEEQVLPPGSEFSRIWCDKGLWKPVRAPAVRAPAVRAPAVRA